VKQQVARRGRRVVLAPDLAKWVQAGRARRAKQGVPRAGAKAQHAAERARRIAKTDAAQQARQIGAQPQHRVAAAGLQRDDQKNGGAGERRIHRLRHDERHGGDPLSMKVGAARAAPRTAPV
jgi:hypothetical protein